MRALMAILGGLLMLPGLCGVWLGAMMWKVGGIPYFVLGVLLVVVAIFMIFSGDRRS